MKRRYLMVIGLAALVAAVSQLSYRTTAQSQDIKAAYDRSASLGSRTNGLVFNTINGSPTFIDGGKLWYQKTVKGGTEFVLVDPAAKTKAPAFDHARLATAINTVASAKYTAVTLPFSTFTYVDTMQAIQFAITPGGGGGRQGGGGGGGGRQGAGPAAGAAPGTQYRCTLTTYVCTQQAPPQAGPQGQGRQGGGRQGGGGGGRAGGAPGAAPEEQVRNQPNGGCWQAMIQNFNIYLRPFTGAGAPSGCQGQKLTPFMLSTDGSEGNAYRFQSLQWSPNGQKIAAFRRRPGYDRQVHYIESRPADQLQPKHSSIFYRKPGDVMDFDYPVVFDVASKRMMQGDISLFPNPYQITALDWWDDSRAVTFEYNQRGHEIYRVLELDATTGKTRTLIEEAPKTFVEYSSGKRFRRDITDGREIIWQSERDGWNHLYLVDGTTGTVKNQITKGQWIVRNVVRVDEKNRQIWFNASGMHAGKDPYFLHHYRVNFDGTGLTAFTSEDGTHSGFNAEQPQQPPQQEQQQQQQRPRGPQPLPRGTNFSPDGQYYVDRWDRVDLPPVVALKRTSDQSVVMELEKADASALLATGWKMPEVFVSKARDGVTDIWGIIIKPTNFDPARKYPVIENIYAGPQGSFVPKAWSLQGGMMGLAELGFIVVQVDGLGTSNRSKAFHDVAWKDLGDAGFPDRIIWHKAIAAKYPWYDITRVGIYGTSAGGQNATGGMLFHPDFYKVAVSNSGCHDNRMDKIWWNEQWMGWPLGPHYAASSNVDHAKNLKGKMQLVVPEMDSNVDPASTLQVVAELVRAGKEFELVFIPGANHGAGSSITQRKRNDFFVKHLLGIDPPDWNNLPPAAANGDDAASDEPDYFELERAPFFQEKEKS